MYTLFTRLYDLWQRGSTSPISPDWDVRIFSQGLGDSEVLMSAFSNIARLEIQFCKLVLHLFLENNVTNKGHR
jgi:hypothetical protein